MKYVAVQLLTAALTTIAFNNAQKVDIVHGDFDQWKEWWLIHKYRTAALETRRKAAFLENNAVIEPTLEPFLLGKSPILLGRNMFADTTADEWIKLDQQYPEPDDDDWGEVATRDNDDPDWDAKQKEWVEKFKFVNSSWKTVKAQPFTILEGITFPRRLDWRKMLVVPNYEAICCMVDCRYGSYAWAVVVTLISHLNIQLVYDTVALRKVHPPSMYSVQQLIDCLGTDDVYFSGTNICHSNALGGNGRPNAVVRAYKHVIMNGLMADVDYRYNRGNYSMCKYNKEKAKKAYNPFNGFIKLNRYDEVALVQALALYGPITVSFNANMKHYWLYENGILIPTECKVGKTVSMVLVGYGEERGIKYWLLMSPWGERWGRYGMLKMKWFSDVKGCNIAAQAIYPTWGGRKNVTKYDWRLWPLVEKARAKQVQRVYVDLDLKDRTSEYGKRK